MGRLLTAPKGSLAVRLATVVFVGVVIVTAGLVLMLYQGRTDGEVSDIVFPHGSSLAQVSEILDHSGVVHQRLLFKILLRLTGGASKVRAGEFRFRQGMRAVDALWVLYHGQPIVHHITVPEGWTVRQIADILAAEHLVDVKRFLDLTLTQAAAAKYEISAPNLEGFLYPETYDFSRIDGEERIIDKMVQHFFQIYDKELKAEAASKGTNLLQLVTLASIIEKETGADGEREMVSSVFHNRLKKHMRLQSDPTTIYGLPEFSGRLRKKDLESQTAYNTYVIPALPPGPICNPGIASMRAALNPANTNYLYFVSNNHGSHLFSNLRAARQTGKRLSSAASPNKKMTKALRPC